jgi:hypothetical protein
VAAMTRPDLLKRSSPLIDARVCSWVLVLKPREILDQFVSDASFLSFDLDCVKGIKLHGIKKIRNERKIT